MIDLSISIVSWNTRDLLWGCLLSVTKDQGPKTKAVTPSSFVLGPWSFEVIVIDNASTDGSADMVADEFPDVRLIVNDDNVGFARANNQGLRVSRGRYAVLLNSDTLVQPAALTGLLAFMDAHTEAGAAGPRLLTGNGTAQPYAFGGDPTPSYLLRRGINRLLFRRYLHDWNTGAVQVVDWVAGTCLMVRREAFERAGLLDEHIFMYFEDNDWCLRMRQAGWKVYYVPQAEIVHVGGQSLAKNSTARQAYYESLRYFYRKHYSRRAQIVLGALLPLYQRVMHL